VSFIDVSGRSDGSGGWGAAFWVPSDEPEAITALPPLSTAPENAS
jgi:hypothetical protein